MMNENSALKNLQLIASLLIQKTSLDRNPVIRGYESQRMIPRSLCSMNSMISVISPV